MAFDTSDKEVVRKKSSLGASDDVYSSEGRRLYLPGFARRLVAWIALVAWIVLVAWTALAAWIDAHDRRVKVWIASSTKVHKFTRATGVLR